MGISTMRSRPIPKGTLSGSNSFWCTWVWAAALKKGEWVPIVVLQYCIYQIAYWKYSVFRGARGSTERKSKHHQYYTKLWELCAGLHCHLHVQVAPSKGCYYIQLGGQNSLSWDFFPCCDRPIYEALRARPKRHGIRCSSSTLLFTEVPDCFFQLWSWVILFLGIILPCSLMVFEVDVQRCE